jgi:hypothetical protein
MLWPICIRIAGNGNILEFISGDGESVMSVQTLMIVLICSVISRFITDAK